MRPRKGSKVFAKENITQKELFPTSEAVYYILIPKGAQGKVTSTDEEFLLLVDFGKKHGEWFIQDKHIARTKPE